MFGIINHLFQKFYWNHDGSSDHVYESLLTLLSLNVIFDRLSWGELNFQLHL